MNDLWQWMVVALAVVAATIYLVKRLTRSKDACGCGQCCESCPHGSEFAKQCEEKRE